MIKRLLLSAIILFAFFLRIYKISEVPFCLNWDEVSFGYNSFSILKTGKDEYGVTFPLEFKSIGDYKLPGFIYAMVPVIYLFGLNEFSVRLLPAISGSLSVLAIYYLTKLLLGKNKWKYVEYITSFLLAVSPWHIHFTRAGADTGFASAFTLFGIYFLIHSLIKKAKTIYLSLLCFTISFYSYFGERVFLPLFVIGTGIYFFKKVKDNFKHFILPALIGFAVLVPSIFLSTTSGQKEKLMKTTIFGFNRSNEYMQMIEKLDGKSTWNLLFHNETYEKTLWIINNYLNHFSFGFLFTTGPDFDQRSLIYRMGMLYIFELPLILIGIYSLIKSKNKLSRFILLWLLISPIPAAITRDTLHARRSLNMVYPLTIIAAIGTSIFISYLITLKSNLLKSVVLAFAAGIITYSFTFYYLSYTIFTPLRTLKGPSGWYCGYKEMVDYATKLGGENYQKVVVDTSYQGPYIFFLFYQKYPPEKYQPQARLLQSSPDSLGEGAGFDNYEFRPIFWPDDRGTKNTLFIGPSERLPQKDIDPKESVIVEKQYFVNGEPSFVFVKTNPD